MKNFILATATLFVGANLFGQTVPKGISYQAVAINTEAQSVAGVNSENTYWSNKDIQVRFTIYDQYPGGSAQMVETHQTKTDKFGVFNLVIGQGQNISGDLFDVEWDKGQAHLQVEIDFKNNGLYKLIGIERFWSVPYAFNAQESNNSSTGGGNLDSLAKALQKQLDELKDALDGHKIDDQDLIVGNEIQDLSLVGDSLLISREGNGVLLSDNDNANEIQDFYVSNDTLYLTKSNGYFYLPSAGTDNQKISISGNTIFLERGGQITIPTSGGSTDKKIKTINSIMYTNEGF